MKIDDSYTNIPLLKDAKEASAGGRPEESSEPTRSQEKKNGANADVDLSNTSVEFSKAAEILEKASMDRAEKVTHIKAMVEKGTYEVDSTRVADKILEEIFAGLQ